MGPAWRIAALERLADQTFDALVVGGGATGAAIARDAALRGLQVALCDAGDFAGHTSSHSSKLIHGGLRYLQYGDLGLVFEGLAERHRLMTTAPHLCRPIEFLFPAYRGRSPSLLTLSMGVALYDALALWRPPVQSRRASAAEVYRLAPYLRSAGLEGAALYNDCQTEDARLVLENVLDAESAGAVIANHVRVAVVEGGGRQYLRGAEARDRIGGEQFRIRTRAIVNATGPFSDAFRGGSRVLRPTLGVHLVLDSARLPTGGRAIVINSPRDGRLIFTLPAGARTIVGTTDTDWRSPGRDPGRPPTPDDPIQAHAADVDYLLEAANHAYPPAALSAAEVVSTFAGLRPLIAGDESSPSATSREHEIWVDGHGVLTVAGGKLTTMRSMAEEAVDRLVELVRARGVDRPLGPCTTRKRPLPGAARTAGAADLDGHELAADVRTRLTGAYGTRAGLVAALAARTPSLGRRLVPDLPYLRAEVLFAVTHDRATSVEDVLRRRMPIFRDARDQGLAAAEDAAKIIADELRWTPTQRQRSLDEYRLAVDQSRAWQRG